MIIFVIIIIVIIHYQVDADVGLGLFYYCHCCSHHCHGRYEKEEQVRWQKNNCKYSSPQSINIYPHNPTGEDKRQWPHRRTGPPPRSETTPAPWSNILILLIKCRSPTRAWTRWRSPTSPTCPPTWTRTCPTTWTRVCPPTCRRTCPPSTWVQAIQETSSRRWGGKTPRQGRNFWEVVKIRWTVPPERAPFSLAKSDIGLMVILEECSCWTRCNPLSLLLRRAFLIVVCQFEWGGGF